MNEQECKDTQGEPRGVAKMAINRPIDRLFQNRELVIRRGPNGFIVQVGCEFVVFETQEKMLSELDRYFKNPSEVEKEYMEKRK